MRFGGEEGGGDWWGVEDVRGGVERVWEGGLGLGGDLEARDRLGLRGGDRTVWDVYILSLSIYLQLF